mmetsp:Transcript_11716/g.36228  ORF Transcript_11716/g.36228 Transcript_11716/m.36228 type:complete len:326 (-) Transcript_11716:378-1355(-)
MRPAALGHNAHAIGEIVAHEERHRAARQSRVVSAHSRGEDDAGRRVVRGGVGDRPIRGLVVRVVVWRKTLERGARGAIRARRPAEDGLDLAGLKVHRPEGIVHEVRNEGVRAVRAHPARAVETRHRWRAVDVGGADAAVLGPVLSGQPGARIVGAGGQVDGEELVQAIVRHDERQSVGRDGQPARQLPDVGVDEGAVRADGLRIIRILADGRHLAALAVDAHHAVVALVCHVNADGAVVRLVRRNAARLNKLCFLGIACLLGLCGNAGARQRDDTLVVLVHAAHAVIGRVGDEQVGTCRGHRVRRAEGRVAAAAIGGACQVVNAA